VLNGINGPQGGIAGMLLTAWDERTRSSIKLKPLCSAELSKIEGVNAFAFNLPRCRAGPGGLPVQMVINHLLMTAGKPAVELITICTGRPPGPPGSGGRLNANALTPSILLSSACNQRLQLDR